MTCHNRASIHYKVTAKKLLRKKRISTGVLFDFVVDMQASHHTFSWTSTWYAKKHAGKNTYVLFGCPTANNRPLSMLITVFFKQLSDRRSTEASWRASMPTPRWVPNGVLTRNFPIRWQCPQYHSYKICFGFFKLIFHLLSPQSKKV